MPIPPDEPEIKREDSTPTLAEQCKAKGWDFGFYSFGKGEADNLTFFNPAIIERPDGLWLLTRVSEITDEIFGLNSVYAFQLDETGKVPKVGYKLRWPDSEHNEQHEDARAAYFPYLDQTAVCCCNFIWYGYDSSPAWTGALQVLGFFDSEWECKIKHRPPIGGNPRELGNVNVKQYEKSWMPFFHESKLHIFYSAKPWRVYSFGETWEEFNGYEQKEGISWKYGLIRNGTPPVLVDGLYYSFFHSSLPWKGNYRRYFAGAVAFEAKPPFKPVKITVEPLLMGSQQDPWALRKPPCVFPCGAVLRDGKWLISAGVNDLKSCWIEVEHSSLLEQLTPIGKSVTPIIPKNGLSPQEAKKERLRQNAAKARAALAEKRRAKAVAA